MAEACGANTRVCSVETRLDALPMASPQCERRHGWQRVRVSTFATCRPAGLVAQTLCLRRRDSSRREGYSSMSGLPFSLRNVLRLFGIANNLRAQRRTSPPKKSCHAKLDGERRDKSRRGKHEWLRHDFEPVPSPRCGNSRKGLIQ